MGRQLIIRLLQTFVSLLGMSLLIFILVRASGDPVELMRTPTTTEADMANMRATRRRSFIEDGIWKKRSALSLAAFGAGKLNR